jgi:hypothetical protein
MLLPFKMEHVSQKNLWILFSFVKLLHLAIFIRIDLTVPQSIQTSSRAHPVTCLVGVGGKVSAVWHWPLISIFIEVIRMNGVIPSFLHILSWCRP